MTDHLDRLLAHLEWANRRTLEAARESGDGEALRLLSHLLASERIWLRRIETGDSSGVEIWPDLSPEECSSLFDENLDAYRSYLDSCSEQDLSREVTYRNSSGREFDTPLGEILLHVFLHGTYHRGQIARELRDAGDEPVNTDFIQFVRAHPEEEI